ncbi:hypothetical protein BD309DRAFT_960558 [Dichomitus squalens]|nr:hypothetical protein BD309DRAFT_960558 [Dichomitus squalens]
MVGSPNVVVAALAISGVMLRTGGPSSTENGGTSGSFEVFRSLVLFFTRRIQYQTPNAMPRRMTPPRTVSRMMMIPSVNDWSREAFK